MFLPRFFLPTLSAVAISFAVAASAPAAEHATYNSAGALTGLIHDGVEIPVTAGWFVELTGGVRAPLQPHDQKSSVTRDSATLRWKGHTEFPNKSAARFVATWQ